VEQRLGRGGAILYATPAGNGGGGK
jgi:hypothetical protein